MPPRHGKKLADVMDEAFRNNSRAVDEANTEKAQGDGQSEAPVAPPNATVSAPAKSQSAGKSKGYTVSVSSIDGRAPLLICLVSTHLGLSSATVRALRSF